MMKKYQVVTCSRKYSTAASKAVEDAASILEKKLGYEKLTLNIDEHDDTAVGKLKRQIVCFFSWLRFYSVIEKDSCLVMQHPFYHRQFMRERVIRALKKKKNVKYISLVHDVEELRKSGFNDYFRNEFQFMEEVSDAIIVHNASMKEYFVSIGIDETKLVELEIFDYLFGADTKEKSNDKKIIIAGNLDSEKVGYLKQLGKVGNIQFDMYGPGFDENTYGKARIAYHGVIKPEELPGTFDGGFGLVWDGDSIDTCSGNFGEYLRYNNPHKLSLYLAAGIPAVIWKEAAESSFVEREGVGITVSSISEAADKVNRITDEEYKQLLKNIGTLQHRLKDGYYTHRAVERAEKIVTNG